MIGTLESRQLGLPDSSINSSNVDSLKKKDDHVNKHRRKLTLGKMFAFQFHVSMTTKTLLFNDFSKNVHCINVCIYYTINWWNIQVSVMYNDKTMSNYVVFIMIQNAMFAFQFRVSIATKTIKNKYPIRNK